MKKRPTIASVLAAAVLFATAPLGGCAHLRKPSAALRITAQAASGVLVSGFIYEAVRSNRIEGAAVTLYCEDGEGGSVRYGDGQGNPQTTDKAGAYRWDMAGEEWRVEIAKEHYQKTSVDRSDVSSANGDVAVPLVSTLAPEVVGVAVKKDCLTLTFSQYMDLDTIDDRHILVTCGTEPVECEIWPADSEVSGTDEYVFYASSFNLIPEKEPTEITVRGVKNYAGAMLKGTCRIPAQAFSPFVAYTRGDVDGDGAITSADARLTLRASVGLYSDGATDRDFSKGARMFLAADYDGDGEIRAEDARRTLRAAVGLEKDSNSGLITYANLTDKHDDRTRPIDTITIHHMSGVMTAQACCDYFCETSREVSANYCIGYDGSIALNVEEKYRAWTSSSEANDMRAVTIEVSNDSEEPYWHVSDISIEKLIDLCADICRRNGIAELVYTGDAYGSLTMHKMFIDTDCPGPYLSEKIPYIAQQVNKRLSAE